MIPLTAAGVLLDELDGRGNRRNDLCSTATISDDGHSFSCIVDGMIPTRSVKHRPMELLHSGEFDIARVGNSADRGYKDGCCSLKCNPSLQALKFDVLLLLRCVPFGSDTLDLGVDVPSKVKFIHCVFHVFALLAYRIVAQNVKCLHYRISGCSQSSFDQLGFKLKLNE